MNSSKPSSGRFVADFPAEGVRSSVLMLLSFLKAGTKLCQQHSWKCRTARDGSHNR